MEYGIKVTKKNNDAYYFVNWSTLAKADKYSIISKVPEVAGIYEVYWMDEGKRLRLFVVANTNYNGLRTELREITDPELCRNDEKAKKILEEKELWIRYAPTDSAKDMADVIWFFMQNYFPEDTKRKHSGRYENIFLKESAPDKLMWVP